MHVTLSKGAKKYQTQNGENDHEDNNFWARDMIEGYIKNSQKYIENLSKQRYMGNDKVSGYNVFLRVERQDFFKDSEKLKDASAILSKICGKCKMSIEIFEDLDKQDVSAPISYSYSGDELKKAYKIMGEVNVSCGRRVGDYENLIRVFFRDSATEQNRDSRLSLKDVITINEKIDKVVNVINEKQFTPYEAMIYIHNYLTSFEYTRAIKEEANTSRMLVGSLLKESKYIVCSGYASLCKAIIDKLNMPGLECSLQGLNELKANNLYGGSHTICLIRIKDEKYSINGQYCNDASHDNIANDKYARFNHFLYPISDNNFQLTNKEVKTKQKDENGKYIVRTELAPISLMDDNSKTRHEEVIAKWRPPLGLIKDAQKRKQTNKMFDLSNEESIENMKAKYRPISVDTLIEGLYNVIEKTPEMAKEYDDMESSTKEAIHTIIKDSLLRCLTSFGPQAINGFTQIWKDAGYFELDGVNKNPMDEKFSQERKKVLKGVLLKINDMVEEFNKRNTDKDNYGR